MSESNYHTTNWFSEDLLAMEMKKTKVKMNKPVYLGLLTLDISKTLMNEFWYDYMKPKYQNNAKLCYLDTDSFIIHIKTEHFYKDLQIVLKMDMIHQIMKLIDHSLLKGMNKSHRLNER